MKKILFVFLCSLLFPIVVFGETVYVDSLKSYTYNENDLTVVLNSDISLPEDGVILQPRANSVIDLNGHTLSCLWIAIHYWRSTDSITIIDSSENKTGKIKINSSISGQCSIGIYSSNCYDTSITINGGTFIKKDPGCGSLIDLSNRSGGSCENYTDYVTINNGVFDTGYLLRDTTHTKINIKKMNLYRADGNKSRLGQTSKTYADVIDTKSELLFDNAIQSDLSQGVSTAYKSIVVRKKTNVSLSNISFEEAPDNYNNIEYKPIVITNNENNDTLIKSVSVVDDYFEIDGPSNYTINANAVDNTSFRIRPKNNLSIGTYNTTIRLVDENDKVTTATVSITIKKTYKVEFNSNGLDVNMPNDIITIENRVISKPNDPTTLGYDFLGWYKESSCQNEWDFDNDIVNSNKTLYAKWKYKENHLNSSISSKSLKSYLSNSLNLNSVTSIKFNDIYKSKNVINSDNRVDISKDNDGKVMAIIENNTLYIQYDGMLYLSSDSSNLFKDFTSVNSISGFEYVDTSNVVNMSSMFSNCSSLIELDLTTFKTNNVTNIDNMFYKCVRLKKINVSFLWNSSKITSGSNVFKDDVSLVGYNGTEYDSNHIGYDYARIDLYNNPGYFSIEETYESDKYDLSKDYIYTGIEEFDISKITISSGLSKVVNDDKLYIKYDNKNLQVYDIVSVFSTKYDLSKDYIYIGNDSEVNLNNIVLTNATSSIENGILYIKYNDIVLKQFEIISAIRNVSLNKNELSLLINTNETLEATINPSNTIDDKTLNWTSSDSSVATVDSNGKVTAVKRGTATITVKTSNNKTNTCIVTVKDPKVLEINTESDEYSKSLNSGSFNINYNVVVQDNYEYNLEFTNTNPSVATISNDGTVTIKGLGETYITLSAGNVQKTIKIVIYLHIESVSLNKNNIELIKGNNEKLNATINPENTTDDKTLNWTSSDSSVVSVDENGNVTAIKRGTAIITVKTTNNKTSTCEVIVKDSKVLSISTDKDNYSINIDDKTFNINYEINTQDNPKYSVSLTSNNNDVVTVNNSGLVTIVNPGEATILINAGGVEKEVNVSIYSLIKSVSLNKKEINMLTNSNETLLASINPENTTESKLLTWTSSDENVATVDSNGKVTTLNPGIATITVTTSNGKTDECIINVLSNIVVESNNADVLVNGNLVVGEMLSLNITPNKGYKVTNIKVIKISDETDVTTEVGLSNNTLTVPNYDIKIIVETVSLKLSKPSLTIKKFNNNSLILNYNKQEVEKYIIYRSLDNKKWNKYKEVKTNTFTDNSLTYGKTYYYKIKAYNSYNGNTVYSNIVSKKVTPNKVVLKITSVGTNNVKLSWDKVSVTGYEVYRSTNNKKWSKVTTITKNSTLSYNNTKLTANKKYYYKVRAYKTVSGKKVYGSYSSVVSTKTAPVKPKVSISVKDYNALNIKVSESKGSSKYIIDKSLDDKIYTRLAEIDTAKTYTDSELEFNKTYYYRIKACNKDNRCSGWVKVNKKQTTKVPSLTLKTIVTKKINITVGSVNMADGYEVYRSTSKSGKYTSIKTITDINKLSFDNTTKKGTTYYYKVRSYKVVDSKKVYSDYSGIKSIKSK